ncbi:hypothetical protein AB835_14295 [Candidatus Endobugula sertula]|uniref:Solute-binding protein family 3/N-terminal domain-containing protein n=1 Tax=Candidatus Endobugula sertula TaxID=62101 RepID=A0A1D2QLG6_9GAMM|nr:hypothetical protein AB835_14295 [Candidatus Endobugula sertula]
MRKVIVREWFVVYLLVFWGVGNIAYANELCQKPPPSNSKSKFAQCAAFSSLGRENKVLSVAVRNAPPFVYEEVDSLTGARKLKGIAVDFWETVADSLELDYQYVCVGLSDTLDSLQKGTIDIAISPLTITKQRERSFDFSHQYFNSGLVFASSPAESNFDFQKAFNTLSNAFKSDNVVYLFAIFATLLLILVILGLKNFKYYQAMPVMKDKSKPAMVMHVVLYSLLNISGIRKDVFGFSSVSMQLFSVLILIFGITVSTSLFSMVTAALTQSVSPQKNFSMANIGQYSVSTLRGSTAQRFLCDSDIRPASLEVTSTWEDALLQIADGKKDIVLGDWVQLVYLSQIPELRDKVTVHGQSFQFEPYGWGLRTNHPDKDRINQELIGLLRHKSGSDIIKRYIGDKQISLQVN